MAHLYKPLEGSPSLDLSGQGHSTCCLPTNPAADVGPSNSSDDETSYSTPLSPRTAVEGTVTDCDTRPDTPSPTTVDEATLPTAVESLVQDKKLPEDTEDDTTCYCFPSDDVGRVVGGVGQAGETASTDDEDFSWTELEGNSLGLYFPEDSDTDDDGTQSSDQDVRVTGYRFRHTDTRTGNPC